LRLHHVFTLLSLNECMWWVNASVLLCQVLNFVPWKSVSFASSGAIFTDLFVFLCYVAGINERIMPSDVDRHERA